MLENRDQATVPTPKPPQKINRDTTSSQTSPQKPGKFPFWHKVLKKKNSSATTVTVGRVAWVWGTLRLRVDEGGGSRLNGIWEIGEKDGF